MWKKVYNVIILCVLSWALFLIIPVRRLYSSNDTSQAATIRSSKKEPTLLPKNGGELISDSTCLCLIFNPDDYIYSDWEIRKAMVMSLNRPRLLEQVSLGERDCGEPCHLDTARENDNFEEPIYHPVRAKMIFMHRGWVDRDQDGLLEKGPIELSLRLMVDQQQDMYVRLAKLMRQQLSEVGVKLQVILYDGESDLNEGYIKKNRPQAWLRLLKRRDEEQEVSQEDYRDYCFFDPVTCR